MNESRRVRQRCAVVYMKMCDNRLSCSRLALLCGCHRNSVRTWLSQYNSHGLSLLLEDTPFCRTSELEKHKETIMAALNASPVHSKTETWCKNAMGFITYRSPLRYTTKPASMVNEAGFIKQRIRQDR